MPSVEYGRFGRQPTAVNRRKHSKSEPKKRKPRQEICAPLKWLCFTANFVVFVIGVTCLALGVYLCVKDPRPIAQWADIILNPAVMLTLIGLAICIISLMGSIGALRDNITLLKTFAISVFASYIIIVIITFLLFVLFYSEATEGLSAQSILIYAIKNYHTNRNLADFVDYIQEQLECCGVSSTSQGYRDWQLSDQFNCSAENPYPEKCGVPFSCCKRSVVSEAAAGSTNPLLPAIRSLECWQNAQSKRPQELEAELHTRGCLQPIKALFETYAVHVGAFVAIIIVPVCISVCLTNILAKQIDHQHYLLEREARRCERRRRRERNNQFRDPFASPNDAENGESGAAANFRHTSKHHDYTAEGIEHVGVGNAVPTPDSAGENSNGTPPDLHLQTKRQPKPQQKHQKQKQQQRQRHGENEERKKHRRAISCNCCSKSPTGQALPTAHQHRNAPNGILDGKRKMRKRASTNPQTVENRTHQWVLQQSDLVGYEPVN